MDINKNKSDFQFKEPKLAESVYIENPKYNGDFSKVKTLRLSIKYGTTEPKIIDDKGTTRCIAQLTVMSAEKPGFEKKSTPCYLRVTMRSQFQWNKNDFSEEQVNNLMQINAPSLLLSYIRPQVADITEKSDIPTQHIPFINFTTRK